jgi:hypothetical protein
MQILKFASEFRDACATRQNAARARPGMLDPIVNDWPAVGLSSWPSERPGQFHEARNRTCVSRKSRLTLSLDDARATLIDMARIWLRLAKEQESCTPPHGDKEKE